MASLRTAAARTMPAVGLRRRAAACAKRRKNSPIRCRAALRPAGADHRDLAGEMDVVIVGDPASGGIAREHKRPAPTPHQADHRACPTARRRAAVEVESSTCASKRPRTGPTPRMTVASIGVLARPHELLASRDRLAQGFGIEQRRPDHVGRAATSTLPLPLSPRRGFLSVSPRNPMRASFQRPHFMRAT